MERFKKPTADELLKLAITTSVISNIKNEDTAIYMSAFARAIIDLLYEDGNIDSLIECNNSLIHKSEILYKSKND